MAELVKICPNCDTQNAAFASFCEACDWDLMLVPPQPAPEAASPVPPVTESESEPKTEPQLPSEVGPEDKTIHFNTDQTTGTLELLENPSIHFAIADGQTVGRSPRADVLLTGAPHLEYISRIHARFFRRSEQWFVQYVAEGNFIKVDGEEYTDDSEVALENGSLITLSMTTFRWVAAA